MSRVPITESFFQAGNPASYRAGRSVYVLDRDTEDEVAIYSSATGTSELTQPLSTDATGHPEGPNSATGWVAPGAYLFKIGSETFPWNAADPGSAPDASDFGAKGDYSQSDTEAINTAQQRAWEFDLGMARVPAGEFGIGPSDFEPKREGGAGTYGLIFRSNVILQGAGWGATIFKKYGTETVHMLYGASEGVTNAGLRDFRVDGNDPEMKQAGHGILFNEPGEANLEHFFINNVKVQNVGSYGIGLEAGKIINVGVDNVSIYNVGADGIDIKNRHDANLGMILNKIWVKRHGQRTNLAGETGIDVRGKATLSNIFITDYGNVSSSTTGIRMRGGQVFAGEGEATEGEWSNGRHSVLSNFYIAPGNSTATTIGIELGPDNIGVSTGTIDGPRSGILCSPTSQDLEAGDYQTGVDITNVRALNCTTGESKLGVAFRFATETRNVSLTSVIADGCDTALLAEGDRITMSSSHLRNSNLRAVNITSGADSTHLIAVQFDGNPSDVQDNGTNTVVRLCDGGTFAEIKTVASAEEITIGPGRDYIVVTGTAEIKKIKASYYGREIKLRFDESLTVKDGENLKLNGDFSATAADVLSLICDGTNWHEVARSAN